MLLNLVFISFLSHAGCPDLSGTFNCPKYGSQPESKLAVTQTEAKDITTYTYTFDFAPTSPSSSTYSEKGITEDDQLRYCKGKNIFIKDLKSTSTNNEQTHFINKDGDYVVTRQNKEVMHCISFVR